MTIDPHANGVLDTRAAAATYLDRRFWPVPVWPNTKKPVGNGWTAFRADPTDLTPFRERAIGLLLGDPANLVDVDLDCPEAVAVARFFLPPTEMISGRPSAPASHWWYRCPDPPKKAAESFADPLFQKEDVRGMVVELRSTGGQTVVPPSRHPGGEQLAWDRNGEPGEAAADVLLAAVRSIAASALLARYWPGRGSRHFAHLALAGGLLRQGWDITRVETFVAAVAAATDDEETADRVRNVAGTADRIAGGEPATGWPKLIDLLGDRGKAIVDTVREWLGAKVRTGADNSSPSATPDAKYVPLAPWQPFPTDALPEPWASLVRQGAAALGCDEAYLALPALAVLASAIGNTRRIFLGRQWSEPAVVWAAVVGESGSLKSPAFALVTDFLKDRQGHLIRRYQTDVAQYLADLAAYNGSGDEDAEKPAKPTLRRLFCADTTIEQLAGILQENPRGVLVARDELAGWLGSFARYKGKGGGTDLPNWLELHRAGTVVVDRKTGDVKLVYVPYAAASVCGGIQPGVLAAHMSREFFDSGLTARILLAYPPRRPKVWTEVDVHPDTLAAVGRNLDALLALDLEPDPGGGTRPVRVCLSPAAKVAWVAFYNRWGLRQDQAAGDVAAAFSKLEAYAARFALLHHVAGRVEGGGDRDPVGVASVDAGAALAEWFGREAERVYGMFGESEEEADLRALVDLVRRLADRNGGGVTSRALQRSNPRTYRTRDAAEAALESLVTAGVGYWNGEGKPGRGGVVLRRLLLCPTPDLPDLPPDDDNDDLVITNASVPDLPPKRSADPSESPIVKDFEFDTCGISPSITTEGKSGKSGKSGVGQHLLGKTVSKTGWWSIQASRAASRAAANSSRSRTSSRWRRCLTPSGPIPVRSGWTPRRPTSTPKPTASGYSR
ncbi:DUF3987 domain-containing protein [Fimbriiglobus ruber]|uniref:DNA primase/polymerase bifunctional N-terminal domain-containing protein n=1 Tax=Fimbriiglobus ruber TaxID=1908690 RepID=A0A225DEJ6_9BACT|nr:DUF3987 domain-containing protein [Fimbriiglobus ruber]OWK39413.1 hypothetical protein FRUB_05976 [Fimbriiglobus ruber]